MCFDTASDTFDLLFGVLEVLRCGFDARYRLASRNELSLPGKQPRRQHVVEKRVDRAVGILGEPIALLDQFVRDLHRVEVVTPDVRIALLDGGARIAVGNALEAIAGGWLLREFADVDRSLDRLRQVTALIILGAMASTTISASIGVLSLCAGGLQSWDSFAMLWRTWWLGDAMGDVLLAPLLLTLPVWFSQQRDSSWFELLSLEALAIVLSVQLFSVRSGRKSSSAPPVVARRQTALSFE